MEYHFDPSKPRVVFGAAETAYFNIRALQRQFGIEDTEIALKAIAQKLTNALQLMPGCEDWCISYCNILERDSNPGGHKVFFRITTFDINKASPTKEQLDIDEPLPPVERDPSEPVEIFGTTKIAKE